MKTNVAVFFGGVSVEHEVSIISAVQAMHSMNTEKYNIIPIYITKDGIMLYGDKLNDIETFRRPSLNTLKDEFIKVIVARDGDSVYIYNQKAGFKGRKPLTTIDIAFPIVHGTNVEDGALSGWFELLGIPYVGCDVLSAAVGMDKAIFKDVLNSAGVPVLPHIAFFSKRWSSEKDEIIAQIEKTFDYPVIVKPANLGSSVGISKAKDRRSLEEAVDLATSFAQKILVERAVTSLREINCSVLGDMDECNPSECEEPVMTGEILSYNDKYISDSSASKGMQTLKRKLPAELSEEKAAEIKDYACRTFKAMGCNGVVRIDFLIDTADGDKVYVNEANTIPGSLAFYLWEATGKKYTELLDDMIALGFKRDRAKKQLMFTYDTNILDGVGSFGTKGAKGSKF
ncbi:MAG: D-alanine--D-alanine ligase [Clostridia bacterium]|nr:D-alanine--D-alanine ligase [Clostridia bacterium]